MANAEQRRLQRRLWLLKTFVVLAFGVLAVDFWFLQVVQHEIYLELASNVLPPTTIKPWNVIWLERLTDSSFWSRFLRGGWVLVAVVATVIVCRTGVNYVLSKIAWRTWQRRALSKAPCRHGVRGALMKYTRCAHCIAERDVDEREQQPHRP